MIRFKAAEMRTQKEHREGRTLSLRTISKETCLSLGTVHRLMNGDFDSIHFSTLDILCRYFNVSEIGELIEYVPDAHDGPV